MPRQATTDRAAKAAEAKERAAVREAAKQSPYVVSDDEFKERIAAYNRENPHNQNNKRAAQVADKYISRDGGPPVDINAEIERAAKLSVLDFERERKAIAAKLSIRTGALDQAVQQKREELSAPEPEPAPDHDEIRKSAAHIIESHNVLDLFAQDFGKVIAGEGLNGRLLYLVATSRLLDRTMNAAIKGTSAGGKSEIRKRVLEFFPPESVVSFTSLSEKALLYFEGDFAHKILSMGEATASDEQGFQDYLLRELISENKLRYPTVQKVGNELVTVVIEKNGPVAFLVTTTQAKLHPENETRMLSLEIDDSKQQTKNVMNKVAEVEGLNLTTAQVDFKPWQNFQRWLELGELRVVVPFASQMTELTPPEAVRLRRDIGQVIRAVKTHAILHREHRARDSEGRVIADLHDYEAIRALLGPIVAEGSGVAVTKAMAETIRAVEEATVTLGETEGASAQDIARILRLDKSAARRRLLGARDEGYVANLEQRRGMPGKYRRTAQRVEGAVILPTTEDVRTAHQTPQKIVPPCHREENAETNQEDSGGNDGGDAVEGGGNPVAVVAPVAGGGAPMAKPLATVKPLDGNGEAPPVAGWQPNSGGYATGEGVPCLQCGLPIGPGGREVVIRSTGTGQLATVHEDCLSGWQRRGPTQ